MPERTNSRTVRHAPKHTGAGLRRVRWLVGAAAAAALVLPGCGRQPEAAKDTEPSDPYGHLPALKDTADPELREEYSRIVDEGGTPAQLTAKPVPEAENVAVGLTALFPKKMTRPLLSRTSELFPVSGFEFNSEQLQQVDEFLSKYGNQIEQARSILSRPRCDFGIDYRKGFAAELSFVDVAQTVARLEAFRAALALEADNLGEATLSLSYMFRVVSCLAAEKHPIARLNAAFIRSEAFQVLRAIALHPRTGPEELKQLQQMIASQLSQWPDEADVWIADRAVGLHAYEVVRDGGIMSLLTKEEVQQFEESGTLARLRSLTPAQLDDDQLYYMNAMQEIIASCSQPYYERVDMLKAMTTDLEALRATSDFPLVAGLLLLPDVPNGHLLLARERAQCEAWALALARALNQPDPSTDTNPVTGHPYRVERDRGRVLVYDEADNPATTDPLAACREMPTEDSP